MARPVTNEGLNLDRLGAPEWRLVLLVSLVWGASFTFIELGLETLHPTVIAFARVLFGSGLLLLHPRARTPAVPIDVTDRWRLAALGLLWMAGPMVLIPWAQQVVGSSVAGMVNGSLPVLTVVVTALLLRRWPASAQLWGVLAGSTGITLIALEQGGRSPSSAGGVALLVLAFVLLAVAANLAVPLTQRYGSLAVVLRAQLFALGVLLPAALLAMPASTFSWRSALAMVPLGLLSSGVAYVALAQLVGSVGADRGTVALYGVPVVAMVLGRLLFDEHIRTLGLIAAVLVIGGAWLTGRRRPPRPDPRPPSGPTAAGPASQPPLRHDEHGSGREADTWPRPDG
jgi:drug/metabolite transporter (DMT)-like permease